MCTLCREPMVDLGRDFRAPRREDVRQWRKIALLFERGIRFDSCGCSGPGPRPRTLADARAQFALRRQRRHDQPSKPRPFARRRKSGRITPVYR